MSRRRRRLEWCREGCPFSHFGGMLAVNFKLYSMNKTVKIHQNPGDTSEYDAIKRGKQ